MTLARLHSVDTASLTSSLTTFVAEVGKLPVVRDAILFGSMAEGKMTAASDIDLAFIVSDECDIRAFKEHLRAIKRSHLAWPCDLVVMTESWFAQRKDFGGLCMEIAASGKHLLNLNEEGNIG